MLDLSKRKKKYFNLILHDGTKLQIPPPTREIYGAMLEISKKEVADEEELNRIISMVLKTNKQGIEITQAQIDAFDLDDMCAFFLEYAQFTHEILTDPNSKSPIVP